jgi:uncharacterized membrane protein
MNNTLAYIIFAIVMLHLVAGFVWAFIKMNKKPAKKVKKTDIHDKERK